LQVEVADIGGLGAVFAGRRFALPPVAATADVQFEGGQSLRLTAIEGSSGDVGFSGALSTSRIGAATQVSGDIALERANVVGLGTTLFGRVGLLEAGDGAWPIGPVVLDEPPGETRGTVMVTAPTVALAGEPWLEDASFELSWDSSRLRLAGLTATLGEGTLTADVAVCCAGLLTDKTVSGRTTLNAVAIADVVPPAVAATIGGTVSGGLQFEGTGADLATIAGRLAGEGSFAITDLTVTNMTPQVYESVSALDNILEMEPDALEAIIALSLDQGAFNAAEASGAFTIAGGVARLANLSFQGEDARLAGGIDVTLDTLALDGAFTLTPLGFDDPGGIVSADTARIVSRISGTLLDPVRTLDLSTMVAAVRMRANELEVERLEALRIANEERQRAAAEARNRLVEEQMRQRAAEEAERLAEEEAARRASEEERVRQRQEEERLAEERESQDAVTDQPLTLQPGFQPGVDEPVFQGPLDIGPPTLNQSGAAPATGQPFFAPLN
jgi:flagellar biosynthesis GTPase FlhF